MHKLMVFVIFLSLATTSCVTKPSSSLSARAVDKSGKSENEQLVSCEEANYECSPYQPKAAYLCSAYHKGQRVLARGETACLARRSLYQKSCEQQIDIASLSQLNCIPDPSRGECPTPKKVCTFEYQPTVCRAQRYDGRQLSWDLMPSAWGSNPCVAKLNLQEEACHSGIVPSLMAEISCENDHTEGACPPKRDCEERDDDEAVVCTVEEYGDGKLERPWTVFAPSRCEAVRQIHTLACRFANAENQLKPSMLGKIECESPD
jgi:hypothetical protein